MKVFISGKKWIMDFFFVISWSPKLKNAKCNCQSNLNIGIINCVISSAVSTFSLKKNWNIYTKEVGMLINMVLVSLLWLNYQIIYQISCLRIMNHYSIEQLEPLQRMLPAVF